MSKLKWGLDTIHTSNVPNHLNEQKNKHASHNFRSPSSVENTRVYNKIKDIKYHMHIDSSDTLYMCVYTYFFQGAQN